MLGGACLAADERLLRWPEVAEKEDWEASVTLRVWVGGGGYADDGAVWSGRTRSRWGAIAGGVRRRVFGIIGQLADVVERQERSGGAAKRRIKTVLEHYGRSGRQGIDMWLQDDSAGDGKKGGSRDNQIPVESAAWRIRERRATNQARRPHFAWRKVAVDCSTLARSDTGKTNRRRMQPGGGVQTAKSRSRAAGQPVQSLGAGRQ